MRGVERARRGRARAGSECARAHACRRSNGEFCVLTTARRMLYALLMNRLRIALTLAVASLTTVACTASSEEGQDEQDSQVAQPEDNVQSTQQALSCHRFPTDTCVSVGTYCRNHGGQLWCDLYGNCVCRYDVIQATQLAR